MGARVQRDIVDGFLHDAKDRGFDDRRQPVLRAGLAQREGDALSLQTRFGKPTQRGNQAQIVEHRRAQIKDDAMDAAQRVLGQRVHLLEQRLGFRQTLGLGVVQRISQPGQELASLVVQFARDAFALLFLRRDDAAQQFAAELLALLASQPVRGGALLHARVEVTVPMLDFLHRVPDARAHGIERAREGADFIAAKSRDRRIQVARGNPAGSRGQRLHGDDDAARGEVDKDQVTRDDEDHQQKDALLKLMDRGEDFGFILPHGDAPLRLFERRKRQDLRLRPWRGGFRMAIVAGGDQGPVIADHLSQRVAVIAVHTDALGTGARENQPAPVNQVHVAGGPQPDRISEGAKVGIGEIDGHDERAADLTV